MSKAYEKLPATTLLPYSHFSEALYTSHLEDPAIALMINLEQASPTQIEAKHPIIDNLLLTKLKTEHFLFVTNWQKHILGVITAEDIQEGKLQKIMRERHIRRTDIQATMVMTPYEQIFCLELEKVKEAVVSNIVATLIESGQHYALVVEKNAQMTHSIKGFFLASFISHALEDKMVRQVSQHVFQF